MACGTEFLGRFCKSMSLEPSLRRKANVILPVCGNSQGVVGFGGKKTLLSV